MELLSKKLPSNFLDIIVGGEDVKEPKPSPEGVLLAIKEFGCNKEEVLYIGDSIVDAETAQSAQVDFAGVLTWGYNPRRTFGLSARRNNEKLV